MKKKFAEWIQCAAHSLNLVGSTAVECCTAAVNYFGIQQSVYTFLSASPQRWSYLLQNMQNKVFVVKSLSETRWSASSSASKALALNYLEVIQTLKDIAASERQPPMAVHEAMSLVKKT